MAREPFQYILGDQPFWDYEIKVSQGVFIPRPETELLIQEAMDLSWTPREIIDLCTGSGCIAISLAKCFPEAKIYAVDLSQKALNQAKRNAEKVGIDVKVQFLEGDLFSPFEESNCNKQVDLLVSNPPYVSSREFWALTPEIKYFEPPLALLGGPEGMDIIEKILRGACSVLRVGGLLLMEVGEGHSHLIQQYLGKKPVGLVFEKVVQDWAGIDRVVCLKRAEKRSGALIG
jgi:release factor glutamine methyltransferase